MRNMVSLRSAFLYLYLIKSEARERYLIPHSAFIIVFIRLTSPFPPAVFGTPESLPGRADPLGG